MNRKKTIDGMDIIEYLYECQGCNYTHWAYSKKLLMRCPKCFVKKIQIVPLKNHWNELKI